ncbi:MAG TPA: hypothetical protein VHB21_15775 [Minicystis sp.]|nr:hypothetical protein [Minicystis sp.]
MRRRTSRLGPLMLVASSALAPLPFHCNGLSIHTGDTAPPPDAVPADCDVEIEGCGQCPTSPPTEGGACAGEQRCAYGGLDCPDVIACVDQIWLPEEHACPAR